jgi:hypothetical protein
MKKWDIRNCTAAALAGAAALMVGLRAQAQESPRARGGIYLGAFITDRTSEAQLNSADGSGTDVDVESDLGLPRSMTVGRLAGYYWFKKRQRVDFSIFDLSRTGGRRIQGQIVFGDQTFAVDTVVETSMDSTITKADYTWAFLTRDRAYLGVTAGLYVSRNKLTLSDATFGQTVSENLNAPLPVVGFRGEKQFANDRITIEGAVQVFDISTTDASGHLLDAYIGANYNFGRRMAVGLAYNDVGMNITAEQSRGSSGKLNWDYDGWLLYVKAKFGER